MVGAPLGFSPHKRPRHGALQMRSTCLQLLVAAMDSRKARLYGGEYK